MVVYSGGIRPDRDSDPRSGRSKGSRRRADLAWASCSAMKAIG